jgi:pyridoxal phosphate enzyme (YggS family)
MMSVKENIRRLRERIAKAAERAGRTEDEIALVAVTKTISPDKIQEAIGSGITIIGENRVQEAKEKYNIIGEKVEWHMVGHLQTNKVKNALKIFSLIQSLDSLRLAHEIEKRAEAPVDCLIEVNTSKEPSKFGATSDELSKFFEALQECKKIKIRGLMTIGPGWAVHDPEASRPCFQLLRDVRDRLAREFSITLPILSMGMTSDYEVAIEEGSTMIRVGTAIFGERKTVE